MAVESFYFTHDYNARSDRKMVALQMAMGMDGIGIYWCIIEMLYEEGGYMMLSECDRIAFELRTEPERITKVINGFGLFHFDEVKFWSESVLRRLDVRHQKSENARNSAFKRWNDAKAMRSHSEGNAIKERKGKERKEKKGKEIKEKIICLGEKSDLMIKVKSPYMHGNHYLIYGEDGYLKMLEQEGVIMPKEERPHLQRFLKEKNGCVFEGDISFVINSFKKFIQNGQHGKPKAFRI